MSAVEFLQNSTESCLRCKDNNAELITRKERFCGHCFVRFIRSKQRKLMSDEKFKVKYNKGKVGGQKPPKVMLTCSFGKSSLVLLDVVISMLQEQAEMHGNRQGFELFVVHIRESHLDRNGDELLHELEKFYGPTILTFKTIDPDSYLQNIKKLQVSEFAALIQDTSDHPETVAQLLDACPDKSSREDLSSVMYEQLLMQEAIEKNCDTIVYGHNMTRLANEIIALTVKGRGSSIHEKIADRDITVKGGNCLSVRFPLRDVLQAEVDAYVRVRELTLFEAHSTLVVSTVNRNMTVRQLTTKYFDMLDATGYATTASTVVKTGDKLGPPKDSTSMKGCKSCKVCGGTIYHNPQKWLQNITVNQKLELTTEEEIAYSQEYAQQTPAATDFEGWEHIDTCYGCLVTLGNIKSDKFAWRVQETLDEYILTDDEE